MERMSEEELKKELEKLKDFKVYVFEGDVYVKAEDYKEKAIENKNLNIKVASLEGEIKGLNYTIEKLREENQTLELWLDNKEKVNKSLREELEKLKSTYVYDAKQVRDIC